MADNQYRELAEAVWMSHREARRHRKTRLKLIRDHIAGDHFTGSRSEDGHQLALPLISRTVDAIVSELTSSNPTAEIDANAKPDLQGIGELGGALLTLDMAALKFSDTAEDCLIDALCGGGFAKVGRDIGVAGDEQDEAIADANGLWHVPGKKYVDRVSPENFIADMTARHHGELQYQGEKMRSKVDVLLASGLYERDAVERLAEWEAGSHRDSSESTEGFWNRRQRDDNRYSEYVEVVEVLVMPGVIGREAMLVTLPGGLSRDGYGGFDKPLRVQEYAGDPMALYHWLGLKRVPDSVMPNAPAAFWQVLASMANAMLTHIIEEERKRKTVLAGQSEMTDAQVIAALQARTWSFIRGNLRQIGAVTVGGASGDAWQAFGLMENAYSRTAFNADALTGAGSGNEKATATEIQSINSRLSSQLGKMEQRFYGWGDSIVNALWGLLAEEPDLDREVTINVAGFDLPMRVTADMLAELQGDPLNFTVKRGSMRRMTAEEQDDKALQRVGVVMPLAANIAQLTPQFDAEAFVIDMLTPALPAAKVQRWFRSTRAQLGNAGVVQQAGGMVPMPPQQAAPVGAGGFGPPVGAGVPGGPAGVPSNPAPMQMAGAM